MRILGVLLLLCVANTNKVSCEDDSLTVLFEGVGDVLSDEQDESTPSNSSFPLLQSSGLIESLEKSRTKTIEERLDSLIWIKIDLETKLREAISFGSALSIFNLMKERFQLVKKLNEAREELIGIKLDILDRKRQVVKKIVESEYPISFDLIMQTLSLIYGEDLAPKIAELRREAVQEFEKPFLRPVITVSSPDGLPKNCSVVTAIYQNFQRQNTPVLKNNDFTIVTTVHGFTADNLHLGVDFYAVNHTDENPGSRNSSEGQWDIELLFQREVIETQMNLTQSRLQKELEDLRALTKQQKKGLDHKASKASDGIEKLENKLARKIAEINYEKAKKQMKLIAKQLEKQREFLRDFDKIEEEALGKLARITKKIQKKQENILDEKLKKKRTQDKSESKKAKKDKKKKHGKGKDSTTSEKSAAKEQEVTESPNPAPQSNATVGTNSTEVATTSEDVGSLEIDTGKSENGTSAGTEISRIVGTIEPSPQQNSTTMESTTKALNRSGEIGVYEDEVRTPSSRNSSLDEDQSFMPSAASIVIVNSTKEFVNDDSNQTETIDSRPTTVLSDEDILGQEKNATDTEDQGTQNELAVGEVQDETLQSKAARGAENLEVAEISATSQPESGPTSKAE